MRTLSMNFVTILIFCLANQSFAKDLNRIEIEKNKIEKIKKIKMNFHEESKVLRKDLTKEISKIDEMLQGESSEAEIKKQFEYIGSLRSRHQKLRFSTILKIRRLLPLHLRKNIKKFHNKKSGQQLGYGCSNND